MGSMVGSSIMATSNLIGTGLTNLSNQQINWSNLRAQDKWNKQALEQHEADKEFEYQIFELGNEEYRNRQQIAMSDWLKQQEYMSMPEQVSRARDAGINPVAATGNLQSAATPVVGSSPSVPQSPVAPSYHGAVSQIPMQAPDFVGAVSDLLNAVSNQKVSDANVDKLRSLLPQQLINLLLTNEGQSLANKGSEISNYILNNSKNYKVGQEFNNFLNGEVQYQVLNALQGKYDAEAFDAMSRGYLSRLDFKDKSNEFGAKLEIGFWLKSLSSYLENLSADTQNKRASAAESSSQASVNYATKEQLDFFNKMRSDDDVKRSLYNEVIAAGNKAIADSKISKTQVNIINEQLKQAIYATDMQQVTYWSNLAFKTIESVGNGVSAFYGAGALKQLIELRGATPNPLSRPLESGKGFYMDGGLLFKQ